MLFYKNLFNFYKLFIFQNSLENLWFLVDKLNENYDSKIDNNDFEKNIVLDNKLSPSERKWFSDYLKNVVLADEKVEIAELTKWKLKDFINSEWWLDIEHSMLWKWWIDTLQEKLWLETDWIFWPKTLKALLDFQRANWIIPNWIVWNDTIKALNKNSDISKNQELNIEMSDEILDNWLRIFNKTEKWRFFLECLEKNSDVSFEKLMEYILKSANDYDIPYNILISVIIWESNLRIWDNPFLANKNKKNRWAKWIWQFLSRSFKDLYSKTKWNKWIAVEWNILQYLNWKWLEKYSKNIKEIWINNLNDRYNPEKSILAIWAYLRYILITWKWVNWDIWKAIARFNLWPNWKVVWHLDNNPAVEEKFVEMYWVNWIRSEQNVLLAAWKYYEQYYSFEDNLI